VPEHFHRLEPVQEGTTKKPAMKSKKLKAYDTENTSRMMAKIDQSLGLVWSLTPITQKTVYNYI
jgi:hypothetical protein